MTSSTASKSISIRKVWAGLRVQSPFHREPDYLGQYANESLFFGQKRPLVSHRKFFQIPDFHQSDEFSCR
jgi:hypothetical protein